MKNFKIFLSILLLFFNLIIPGYGALPAATTWEVRTLGADSNGGCFVTGASGTDFSQQNAAQYTFTDLVLATATTASSVSHSFVATDVGNCIHITAGTGFTQGFYQIVSVAGGVLTADRSMGTGGSTGGTYAVGGAIATLGTANTNATASNTVYVKADGTYTLTTTVAIGLDSRNANPYSWIGYTTTRTDNGRATITTATNSTPLFSNVLNVNSVNLLFANFSMTNTAVTRAAAFSTTAHTGGVWFLAQIKNCVMDGFNIGIDANGGTGSGIPYLMLVNSEIKNSISHGMLATEATGVFGSYIHANGGDGINFATGGTSSANYLNVVDHSIISANTSHGVEAGNPAGPTNTHGTYITSSVLSLNTGDGVRMNSSNNQSPGFQVFNSIVYGNGGFGLNNTSVTPPFDLIQYNNGFGSNTSGNRNNISAGTNDITLTANPFTSASNFALNSTAGGGAALKAAGYPGVLVAGGTGFLDVGPLQSQASAGAGTTAAGFVQ